MRRLDGGTVVVEASSAAILLDGKLAVQAVLRDITERRRSEAALRESEARFRLAAAAVQGIVYDLDLLDRHGMALRWAPARAGHSAGCGSRTGKLVGRAHPS